MLYHADLMTLAAYRDGTILDMEAWIQAEYEAFKAFGDRELGAYGVNFPHLSDTRSESGAYFTEAHGLYRTRFELAAAISHTPQPQKTVGAVTLYAVAKGSLDNPDMIAYNGYDWGGLQDVPAHLIN